MADCYFLLIMIFRRLLKDQYDFWIIIIMFSILCGMYVYHYISKGSK